MSAISFVEQCLVGSRRPEEIHDFIDEWHEGTGEVPLWQFLGMTREEYGRWVENPAELGRIIRRRKFPPTEAPQEATPAR